MTEPKIGIIGAENNNADLQRLLEILAESAKANQKTATMSAESFELFVRRSAAEAAEQHGITITPSDLNPTEA